MADTLGKHKMRFCVRGARSGFRWREPALLAHRRDVIARALHFGDDLVGVIKQVLAGLGQGDATPQAVEEAAVQIYFKGLDGVADGGLGEAEFAGGQGKASNSCKCCKGEQLTAVEDGRHCEVWAAEGIFLIARFKPRSRGRAELI